MEYSYGKLSTPSVKLILIKTKKAIKNGNSIIVTGLGKNVPISEKFVGTLTSVGIKSHFMHTNSAIHGDLGMVERGDVVIALSKSGETSETLHLARLLQEKGTDNWLITCHKNTSVEKIFNQSIVLPIIDEGDPWNLIPNNSSLVFLMFLQSLAMSLIEELSINLDVFKKNHPGGAIGETLAKKKPSGNIINIKTKKDLDNNSSITHLFSKTRFLSFDLDGTLIGQGIPKISPEIFSNLSTKYTTILTTGAGLKSIKRKILKHYRKKKINDTLKFSGPIIANEGAQIFKSLDDKAPPLHQSAISKKAIPFILNLVKTQQPKASLYSFYKKHTHTSSDVDYNVLLIDKSFKKSLVKKYGYLNFAKNVDEFAKLLKTSSVVKFVIKTKRRPRKIPQHKLLSIIYNEDCLNITSFQSSKVLGIQTTKVKLQLKMDSNNLVHFGNDLNDYGLLKSNRVGIIVNSNPAITRLLADKLKHVSKNRYVVIRPKLLPLLLSTLANS
jgi:D-arabinose 5-phosphate isomerase GutQ/hydroxymethylpyrimidine pyrophosphatase-like HAD family hydrolase